MFDWMKKKDKNTNKAPAGPTVKVTFADDDLTVETSGGTALSQVCDDADFSLGFGCREGGCATCLIEVVSGGETGLSAVAEVESEMLEVMAPGNPKVRLACQCTVLGDLTFKTFDS